ncbi:MAG: hypothetical protein Q8R24_00800 [Legionellaceae bacterium]|nr:hypothetical protein [Legionellaceae bacterium]
MHKEALEKEYQAEANQLLAIQNKLAAQGKYFQVVIATGNGGLQRLSKTLWFC